MHAKSCVAVQGIGAILLNPQKKVMSNVNQKRRKIVIVGGGITGLTAAYYMQKAAAEQQLSLDVVLIESSLRLGGKIQTLRKNGVIFERGPESFYDRDGVMKQLAKDLQIDKYLMNNRIGPTYVAVGSGLYSIPQSLMLGDAPSISSFLASGLFSLSGKLRAAGDFIVGRTADGIDQPIGPFMRRRFGTEVVENLVEPLLASVYGGDAEQLSLKLTFPKLYELEQQHRSLLRGMRKAQASLLYEKSTKADEGIFQTFDNGLETLIETIEAKLKPGTVLKGSKVESIHQAANQKVAVTFHHGTPILADEVIIATPFHAMEAMFAYDKPFKHIASVQPATIATVNMAFKRNQIRDLDALAFFVSRNSDYMLSSCTWSNKKWPFTASDDYILLRTYIGRVGDESIVDLSDREIERTILQDLQNLMHVKGKPLTTVVTRWKQAMPQYTVGHEERVAAVRATLAEKFTNIAIIGSSYDGVSIPECVAQGKQAVNDLIAKWQ